MAYTMNLPAAARRHLQAADDLNIMHRRDVAGYLYGIAAECAIKAMMLDFGLRPQSNIKNDPFYLHYPQLRTTLLDTLNGRRAAPLTNFASNSSFLQHWTIGMRYCKGEEILGSWIDSGSAQARQAVASIGT